MRQQSLLIGVVVLLLMAACAPTFSSDQLSPPQVGEFLRISGPAPDPDTGVETAIYQGPAGIVTLRTREIGAENLDTALSQPPAGALNVGPDPGLGPRDGILFDYGAEYHAAWGNRDWVFVLTADSDMARRNFLNNYGF